MPETAMDAPKCVHFAGLRSNLPVAAKASRLAEHVRCAGFQALRSVVWRADDDLACETPTDVPNL